MTFQSRFPERPIEGCRGLSGRHCSAFQISFGHLCRSKMAKDRSTSVQADKATASP